MMQFYGIRMQNKQNPLPHGPEIAWKGTDVKISCQRPLAIPADYKSTGCIDDNSGEMLDTWAARNGWNMGTPPPIDKSCKAPYGNPIDGAEYTYKGCYRDDGSRTISDYLGDTQSTEECWNRVKGKGYNIMGRQYFGQCFGGNNKDWNRLGPIECCEPLGGGWSNQVFVSKNPILPPAAPAETYDNDKTYAVGATVNFKGQKYRMQEAAGAPGYAPDRQGDRLWVRS
jgi:hypothetical protein